MVHLFIRAHALVVQVVQLLPDVCVLLEQACAQGLRGVRCEHQLHLLVAQVLQRGHEEARVLTCWVGLF